jgi:glutamine synthetase type III
VISAAAGSSGAIPIWAYIIGALGVGSIIAAFIAYLGVRRGTSGSTATSDAATLWNEANAMRKELRDELVDTRKELAELKGKVDLLSDQNDKLQLANLECAQRESALRDRVDVLERSTERRTPRKRT